MISEQAIIGDTLYDSKLCTKVIAITQCKRGDCIYWCDDGSDWHHYLFDEKSILRTTDSNRIKAAKIVSWTDFAWVKYRRLWKLAVQNQFVCNE
jgi:hypothetical protein